MKLIVTGATGFVGGEVIRQALLNPAVSSVVALTRKPVKPYNSVPTPSQAKFQIIILEDWTSPYPNIIQEHLKTADACIWQVSQQISNKILP